MTAMPGAHHYYSGFAAGGGAQVGARICSMGEVVGSRKVATNGIRHRVCAGNGAAADHFVAL